jgi:RNA polymerase sigma factor (sigma-70 family)
MASTQVNPVLRFIRGLTATDAGGEPGDGQLLARFVRHRDEAAFASLLRRHGPMVLGVCRRLLHDPNDAEDAFQATFLVLVRKAVSIGRPELLGNWLYGVAYRTARKARAGSARRRAELRPLPEVAMTDPVEEILWRDLRPVLDEELSRLPDKYRAPVVLCDLEGWTHDEAARRLGCPRETVTTRLTRARARLRSRLVSRGLTLSAGLLTTVLAERAAPAAVPDGLTDLTLRAAAAVAAGRAAAGVISPQVAAITGGVLRAMFWNQLTRVAMVLLAVGSLGAGVTLVARRLPAGEPDGKRAAGTAKGAPVNPTDPAGRPERPASDREKLQGTWVVVSGEHNAVPFEESQIRGHRIRFKGDEVTLEPAAEKTRVTFAVGPRRTPRVLTMTAQEGRDKGKAIPWIYQLDGDRLKLCWDSQDGKKVPTKFATERESGLSLLVLRRLKPGEKLPEPAEELHTPPADPARQDRDKLQGTWQAVSGEADGQALPEESVKDYKMVVTGDRMKLTKAGDGGEGTLKLDPTQKPKTIDIEISENEKAIGIYELNGDELRLCMVEDNGLARPTEFEGKDKAVFFVFKRVPAEKKP